MNKCYNSAAGGGAHWDKLVAAAINSEAKTLLRKREGQADAHQAAMAIKAAQAQQQVQGAISKPLKNTAKPSKRKKGDDAPEPPPKRDKGKGAIDLFKIDFCAERRPKGLTCNPASTEFWRDLRDEWKALTDEMRKCYNDNAESSKKMALLNRVTTAADLQLKQHHRHEGQPRQSRLAVSCESSSAPSMSAGSLLVANERVPTDGTLEPVGPTSMSSKPEFPMSEAIMKDAVDNSLIMYLAKDFKKTHSKVQPCADGEFPAKVQYDTQCRGLCRGTDHRGRARTPPEVLAMEDALVHHFDLAGTAELKSAQDLLYACEVFDEDGHLHFAGFALLACVVGRHSRFPSHQQFVLLDLVSGGNFFTGEGGARYVGCHAHVRHCPVVPAHSELHRQFRYYAEIGSSTGLVASLSESKLAASLLSKTLPRSWAKRVVLHSMESVPDMGCDGELGRVRLTGVKAAGEKQRKGLRKLVAKGVHWQVAEAEEAIHKAMPCHARQCFVQKQRETMHSNAKQCDTIQCESMQINVLTKNANQQNV